MRGLMYTAGAGHACCMLKNVVVPLIGHILQAILTIISKDATDDIIVV